MEGIRTYPNLHATFQTLPEEPLAMKPSPTPGGSITPPTGPIPHDELLAALNELLEAERAGARVAMETGREVTEPEVVALVADIHKDEVQWCGMLMRTIQRLGARPSSATGAFHGKAMAIAEVEARLLFLNRGQAWVVRKLQALIPRVDDAALRADLQAMLEAHHVNIARVEARSAAR
jgi:hypothetical protein